MSRLTRPLIIGLIALAAAACDPISLVEDDAGRGDLRISPYSEDAGIEADLTAAPSCLDGIQDGLETSDDCGGPVCAPCTDGRSCAIDSDCTSGQCQAQVCVSCSDGVRNGSETDIDCGGGRCARCAVSKRCFISTDCLSNWCGNGTCRMPTPTIAFSAPDYYNIGGQLIGLATGDFNGDKRLDVAALDAQNGQVDIIPGRGDGTLAAVDPWVIGQGGMRGIAAGDLDGDGIDDLVVGSGSGTSLTLRMSARGVQTINLARSPRAVVIADFDGDKKRDIGVATINFAAFGVLRGNGAGGFQAMVDTPISCAGEQLAVGDVDGDGRADVAINGQLGPTQVLLGAANLMLKPLYNYDFPDIGGGNKLAYAAVGIGHLDSDQHADVVTTQEGDALQPLLGDGSGYFQTTSWRALTRDRPMSLAVADFNADGVDDIAVGCDVAATLQIYIANGKGTFAVMAEIVAPAAITAVHNVDLNGDGKADIAAIAGNDTVMIVLDKSH